MVHILTIVNYRLSNKVQNTLGLRNYNCFYTNKHRNFWSYSNAEIIENVLWLIIYEQNLPSENFIHKLDWKRRKYIGENSLSHMCAALETGSAIFLFGCVLLFSVWDMSERFIIGSFYTPTEIDFWFLSNLKWQFFIKLWTKWNLVWFMIKRKSATAITFL